MFKHLQHIAITALFASLIILTPHLAFAQDKDQMLSLNKLQTIKDAPVVKEPVYQIDNKTLADLVALRDPCGACDAWVGGTWDYRLLRQNNLIFSEQIKISQHGKSFKGVANHYTLNGSARGNWLNFTLVVSGEEGMGWVIKVDASIDGDRITGVFLDSDGGVGSFVAHRR